MQRIILNWHEQEVQSEKTPVMRRHTLYLLQEAQIQIDAGNKKRNTQHDSNTHSTRKSKAHPAEASEQRIDRDEDLLTLNLFLGILVALLGIRAPL